MISVVLSNPSIEIQTNVFFAICEEFHIQIYSNQLTRLFICLFFLFKIVGFYYYKGLAFLKDHSK